jgi:hypothetical protein
MVRDVHHYRRLGILCLIARELLSDLHRKFHGKLQLKVLSSGTTGSQLPFLSPVQVDQHQPKRRT